MGLSARTDFRPTGTPTRGTTGQSSGSLLGADLEAWRAFVASVLAAGGRIATDSGNPYDYAYLNPGATPAELAALAAYNEAVTALRGASGGSGGQSSTFAANLVGYDPTAGAAQSQAAPPALLNQTDALDGSAKGLTLADQLAGNRPAIGVPKPLRRQVKARLR